MRDANHVLGSDFCTARGQLIIALSFQNEPESAREAFDAFLARYPYCYGYWKKYADMETKNDNMDEAEKVRCFSPDGVRFRFGGMCYLSRYDAALGHVDRA